MKRSPPFNRAFAFWQPTPTPVGTLSRKAHTPLPARFEAALRGIVAKRLSIVLSNDPKMQGSLPLVIGAWSATGPGVKTCRKLDFPKRRNY
jgi:hypothetical protein